MPLIHRSKSHIRFQGRKKKVKQEDPETAQHKPVRTVYSGDSDSTSTENVVNEEPLFAKKRVPSADELGAMLRSNLSSSLAAAKASTSKQNSPGSPPTPTSTVVQQPQDCDDDPPASFLELAPVYRPVNDRLEATNPGAVVNTEGAQDCGPSASLLATTAIYRPIVDHLESLDACVVAREHGHADNEPLAPRLSATEVTKQAEVRSNLALPTPEADTSAVESSAVEDDDGPPASLLIETRESLIDYIKPPVRSKTVPSRSTNVRPTFLQKVVTLFAGRRRCPLVNEDKSYCVTDRSETQHSLPPRPRRGKPIPPKNLPLSPPVIATHRPYQPIEENLRAPFIEPAKEHKYTGNYSVVPDTFEPAEIQLGFASPTSPASPTLAVQRHTSDGILLDRNNTAWGKWYSKKSKPEDLPFAKVHSVGNRRHRLAEEVTEQQAWDAHCTSLVQSQTTSDKHVSDIDTSRDPEAAVQERASRLRNHPGHCYAAVTGDVYPFQSGLII